LDGGTKIRAWAWWAGFGWGFSLARLWASVTARTAARVQPSRLGAWIGKMGEAWVRVCCIGFIYFESMLKKFYFESLNQFPPTFDVYFENRLQHDL
jgi:hypothetical protein